MEMPNCKKVHGTTCSRGKGGGQKKCEPVRWWEVQAIEGNKRLGGVTSVVCKSGASSVLEEEDRAEAEGGRCEGK